MSCPRPRPRRALLSLVALLLGCHPKAAAVVGEAGPSASTSTGDTRPTDSTRPPTDSDGVPTDSDDVPADSGETTEPPRPTPFPASFHIVDRDDLVTYDAIVGLVDTWQGPLITSQNPPKTVDHLHWAQNVSVTWYADGAEMAEAIHTALAATDTAPMVVMIDELRAESVQMVADAAAILDRDHPEWQGRWGAYLVNGEAVGYPALNPGLDALLDADAIVVAEMYATRSRYCASHDSAGSRDAWLAGFFAGGTEGFGDRFAWLVQRRADRASTSQLQVLFGVTDTYMDGDDPAVFLDRMFYVWKTRSGFPSTLSLENGGVGAWKWDEPYTSNTSRDLAFAESFDHYLVQGLTSSRLGQVDCG